MSHLKDFRKANNFTAKEMADKLGVSLSLYWKVEGDERLPSQNFLARFKSVFPTFDMNIFFAQPEHHSYSQSKKE